MKTTDEQRIFITPEAANNLLPEGDRIHTLITGGFMMIGCDWERKAVLQEIEEAEVREIAGPVAQDMNHGLVLLRKNQPSLFIETIKERIEEVENKFLNQKSHD